MQKIKFETIDGSKSFEIPWEWLPKGTQGPTLNDLESSAERGKLTAKLVRVRAGEIPAGTLDINKQLTQAEIYPLLSIIRNVELYMTYFEKYDNDFKKIKVYVKKINPPYVEVPKDNNTDNILYDKFTIEISAYESIS